MPCALALLASGIARTTDMFLALLLLSTALRAKLSDIVPRQYFLTLLLSVRKIRVSNPW
jgi:hypothetical protein